jgi:ABC-type transport system substrate-binding protein
MITSCSNNIDSIKVLIHHGIGSETIDPSNLSLSDQYIVADNILIKLLEINKNNDYQPLLAKQIKVSENKLNYEFTIKEAKFSDGSRITTNDIVKSLSRVIIKGSSHVPLKEIISGAEKIKSINDQIDGLKILDESRFLIKLNKPIKELYYYLSMADLGILHSSQYNLDTISNDKWEITSGAYRLIDNKLFRNDRYLDYNEQAPPTIEFINPPETGTPKDYIGYDLGTSSFIAKDSGDTITPPESYKYTNSNYDTLCYLVLNTNSDKFKDLDSRQYINRSIIEKIQTPEGNLFFKKAVQFFLPDSFAFQKKFSPESALSNSLKASQATKSGFRILATKGTKKYTYKGLKEALSNATGINVELDFVDDISKYRERKVKRDFDAYLVPTSMSYGVVSESLNILYKSPIRFANNPSGKISKLIDEFQSSQEAKEEIIEQITFEMTRESEIIPLFYVSSPYFYNSEKISIENMNTNESLKFWKLNVK